MFRRLPAVLVALLTFAVAVPAQASPLNGTFADAVAGNILHLINAERAANHLPPVHMNWRLRRSAFLHNQQMYAHNRMSHQELGEAPLPARITATGWGWSWAGENIGWNSDMSLNGIRVLQFEMFNEKPPADIGHRLNILNPHYRYVGIDIRWDFIHHKAWLTEDFTN